MFHPNSVQFFERIDDDFLEVFRKLLNGVWAPGHAIRTHSPIEDGGLGFYKYAVLHPFLQCQVAENASFFLQPLGLRLNAPPPKFSNVLQAWKGNTFIANGGAVERDGRTFLKSDGFVSWLEARPSNHLTRLTDAQFEHQINLVLDAVQPVDGVCDYKSSGPVHFKSLTAKEFSRHIVTCPTCIGVGFLARHEAVKNAVKNTLKFHGIHSYVPRITDLPLPDREKGGPDLIVQTDLDEAIDVTVVATLSAEPGYSIRNVLQEAFTEKMSAYSAFHALTQYRIVPFVMSHFGLVAKPTRDLIQTWRRFAPEPNFIQDLYNNCQFGVIKAQYRTFQFICNKNRLMTEHKKWEQAKAPATEANVVVETF